MRRSNSERSALRGQRRVSGISPIWTRRVARAVGISSPRLQNVSRVEWLFWLQPLHRRHRHREAQLLPDCLILKRALAFSVDSKARTRARGLTQKSVPSREVDSGYSRGALSYAQTEELTCRRVPRVRIPSCSLTTSATTGSAINKHTLSTRTTWQRSARRTRMRWHPHQSPRTNVLVRPPMVPFISLRVASHRVASC
jgi:hypothetical protein